MGEAFIHPEGPSAIHPVVGAVPWLHSQNRDFGPVGVWLQEDGTDPGSYEDHLEELDHLGNHGTSSIVPERRCVREVENQRSRKLEIAEIGGQEQYTSVLFRPSLRF